MTLQEVCNELVPLMREAGVFNIFIADDDYRRSLCSPKEIRISDLFEKLIDLTDKGEKK